MSVSICLSYSQVVVAIEGAKGSNPTARFASTREEVIDVVSSSAVDLVSICVGLAALTPLEEELSYAIRSELGEALGGLTQGLEARREGRGGGLSVVFSSCSDVYLGAPPMTGSAVDESTHLEAGSSHEPGGGGGGSVSLFLEAEEVLQGLARATYPGCPPDYIRLLIPRLGRLVSSPPLDLASAVERLHGDRGGSLPGDGGDAARILHTNDFGSAVQLLEAKPGVYNVWCPPAYGGFSEKEVIGAVAHHAGLPPFEWKDPCKLGPSLVTCAKAEKQGFRVSHEISCGRMMAVSPLQRAAAFRRGACPVWLMRQAGRYEHVTLCNPM